MPVTREEVYWLYRTILGRLPESEDVYDMHLRTHHSFDNARHTFIQSKEFQDKMFPPAYYRPSVKAYGFNKPEGLALATIVKNEEKNIELMLRSCLPIVDFVAILDTGSTDATVEIASRVLRQEKVAFAINEKPFEDFSQARNDALAMVPLKMRWALMLDADEHLMPEDYHLFADLLEANDIDAWALPRYSFTDSEKLSPVEAYPDYQRRLIRIKSDNPVRYTGTIHENITDPFVVRNAPANTLRYSGTSGGPHIHHMGGVITSPDELRRKLTFYMKLSEAGL